MAKEPSRRELIAATSAGLVTLAIPHMEKLQAIQPSPTGVQAHTFAKPLSVEAQRLLVESLKGIEKTSVERLKTKLPENSEPCFTFIPLSREVF